ncbi:hypothetical protein [Celeribacter indicus]|uniref:Uncharacterized protein n=1 Tax=Celeribacter indicus TaxID=1208324 RepID=A0A0B5DS77_9RHOB|nr:hypothetical protein [Celeribacter indicus]AJE45889.1 hypothetical protein P73_1174 [Celeribacter indicus]SDW63077.1 hypothetical protein SAMN05443573_105121 [Celeribacter indicus]
MSETACKVCAFYEVKATASDKDGECRFNPPVFLNEQEHRGKWPVVESEDWSVISRKTPPDRKGRPRAACRR